MKCFTVIEDKVFNHIPVIGDGIGILGQLATITDGVSFPKPEMINITETDKIDSSIFPNYTQGIVNAHYEQYNDPQTRYKRPPLLISGSQESWCHNLVMWIVRDEFPPDYSNVYAQMNIDMLTEQRDCNGYSQCLFTVKTGSSLFLRTRTSVYHLLYSEGTLDIIKLNV